MYVTCMQHACIFFTGSINLYAFSVYNLFIYQCQELLILIFFYTCPLNVRKASFKLVTLTQNYYLYKLSKNNNNFIILEKHLLVIVCAVFH